MKKFFDKFHFLKLLRSPFIESRIKTDRMLLVKVTSTNTETGSFLIEIPFNGAVKSINRFGDETLGKTFERMKHTFLKLERKAKKKRPKLENEEKSYESPKLIDINNLEIPLNTVGISAWKLAKTLHLNGNAYKIIYNPPAVVQLDIFKKPMTGVTLYPLIDFRMAAFEYSKFFWFRSKQTDSAEAIADWELISTKITYTPSENDEGYFIKLNVIPGNDIYNDETDCDSSREVISELSVSHGPKLLYEYTEGLKQFIKSKHSNNIRVVCYNILADCYATTQLSNDELFVYCPEEFRAMNYRIGLIIKELTEYNGDIIALQEVDSWVYNKVLVPVVSVLGYKSCIAIKQRAKEGVAMFFKKDRFEVLETRNVIFSQEVLKKDSNDLPDDLKKMICTNKSLREYIIQRGSCASYTAIRDLKIPSKILVCVNTHLFFHPRANNVRVFQSAIILHYLSKFVDRLVNEYKDCTISYILMGDFNSKPSSGAVELIRTGKLPGNHTDYWSYGSAHHPGESSCELKHDLNFSSVLGSRRYTNYAAGFYEHLDHIFVSQKSLKIDQVLELPPHNKVVEHTALPSSICPSDHIAQVADLSYTN